MYFTRLVVVEVDWAGPDDYVLAALGLGGRLFGALDGRPPTMFAGCEELTNLEDDTLGLWA